MDIKNKNIYYEFKKIEFSFKDSILKYKKINLFGNR